MSTELPAKLAAQWHERVDLPEYETFEMIVHCRRLRLLLDAADAMAEALARIRLVGNVRAVELACDALVKWEGEAMSTDDNKDLIAEERDNRLVGMTFSYRLDLERRLANALEAAQIDVESYWRQVRSAEEQWAIRDAMLKDAIAAHKSCRAELDAAQATIERVTEAYDFAIQHLQWIGAHPTWPTLPSYCEIAVSRCQSAYDGDPDAALEPQSEARPAKIMCRHLGCRNVRYMPADETEGLCLAHYHIWHVTRLLKAWHKDPTAFSRSNHYLNEIDKALAPQSEARLCSLPVERPDANGKWHHGPCVLLEGHKDVCTFDQPAQPDARERCPHNYLNAGNCRTCTPIEPPTDNTGSAQPNARERAIQEAIRVFDDWDCGKVSNDEVVRAIIAASREGGEKP